MNVAERWRDAFIADASTYQLDRWVTSIAFLANDSTTAAWAPGGTEDPTAAPCHDLLHLFRCEAFGFDDPNVEYRFYRDDTLYGYVHESFDRTSSDENGQRLEQSEIFWYDSIDGTEGAVWTPQASLVCACVELIAHDTAERTALTDTGIPDDQTEDTLAAWWDRLDRHPTWPHRNQRRPKFPTIRTVTTFAPPMSHSIAF